MMQFKIIIKAIICITVALCFTSPSFAMERRRSQSPTEPGYIVMPFFISMPGIGEVYGLAAIVENLFGSETDFQGGLTAGALEGYGAIIQEIPIIGNKITFNYFKSSFKKSGINTFGRGMNSDPDKSQFIMLDKLDYDLVMLNFKAYDKMLQFYVSQGQGVMHLDYLINSDGVKYDLTTPESQSKSSEVGMIIDYTDDRNDPRKGIRLESRIAHSPRQDVFNSDYSRSDLALTAYVPFGERNVWATNYYTSSAHVNSTGELDTALIEARLGITCAGGDTQCITERTNMVEQTRLENLNGTASSLGGTMFLRAFPQGRFKGAHAVFMGTEFRWNFSDVSDAFDIFMAKGVQTTMQIAVFTEQGSVAETKSALGDTWAHSTGAGLRLTLQTGMTFRFDVATGEEGTQTTIFFNYPWGVFN